MLVQTDLDVPDVYFDMKQYTSDCDDLGYTLRSLGLVFRTRREGASRLLPVGANVIVEDEQEKDYKYLR
jgi:hypothetical protein